jgi:hypothetical protein
MLPQNDLLCENRCPWPIAAPAAMHADIQARIAALGGA